jgi:hypothetical protein
MRVSMAVMVVAGVLLGTAVVSAEEAKPMLWPENTLMRNAIKTFNEQQEANKKGLAMGGGTPVKETRTNEPHDELTKLRHENEVLKNWLAQSNTVAFVLNEMINQYEGRPASRLVSLIERTAEIYGQGLIREDAK